MVAALKNGELDLAAFIQEGLKRLDPQLELEQEPNMPVAYVATHFGAEGPNFNCLTACAASSQAVGEATEIIRRGEADVMLSGGAHSMIHPFGVTGFNLLTALSENNAVPKKRRARSTSTATASSSARGAAVVCPRRLRTRQETRWRRFTARSSATAPPPTRFESPTRTPKAAARSPA